ncbi:hypothetical protein G7Y89_g10963 [Cudoniella acicularis]|uniref:Uncharacterized protein n=1 Tax=Cudoniella acicularis TaxID=354080 RepID=A0A8H4W132_9HELO|nr:hypothetical protein G7Y89_g10963 [Cudoniella acicularis]
MAEYPKKVQIEDFPDQSESAVQPQLDTTSSSRLATPTLLIEDEAPVVAKLTPTIEDIPKSESSLKSKSRTPSPKFTVDQPPSQIKESGTPSPNFTEDPTPTAPKSPLESKASRTSSPTSAGSPLERPTENPNDIIQRVGFALLNEPDEEAQALGFHLINASLDNQLRDLGFQSFHVGDTQVLVKGDIADQISTQEPEDDSDEDDDSDGTDLDVEEDWVRDIQSEGAVAPETKEGQVMPGALNDESVPNQSKKIIVNIPELGERHEWIPIKGQNSLSYKVFRGLPEVTGTELFGDLSTILPEPYNYRELIDLHSPYDEFCRAHFYQQFLQKMSEEDLSEYEEHLLDMDDTRSFQLFIFREIKRREKEYKKNQQNLPDDKKKFAGLPELESFLATMRKAIFCKTATEGPDPGCDSDYEDDEEEQDSVDEYTESENSADDKALSFPILKKLKADMKEKYEEFYDGHFETLYFKAKIIKYPHQNALQALAKELLEEEISEAKD